MTKLISVLLLSTVLCLPFVRCNVNVNTNFDKKDDDNSSSYSEKSTEKKSEKATDNKSGKNKNEKATENNSSKKEIDDDIKFWITTVEKTEPKDENGIKYIFDKQFGFPVNLSNIEGDGQYLNDIKEALTSEDLVTQYYDVNSETDPNKPTVRFENYTDAIISVADCYEENWWFMYWYANDGYKENFEGIFNPEIGRKPLYDMEAKTSPALNAIVDELGSPDNVHIRQGDVYVYKNIGVNSFVDYELVWTTSDYTLVIGVYEAYYEEYDSQILSINEVNYYTPECWGYQKIYFNDANYKEYIIE